MWHDVRLLNAVANTFFALFALALLVAGVRWLMHRPFFTLEAIQVQEINGRELSHVNAHTIRNIALPRIEGNFFTVNLNAVSASFKAVPWVRDVTVRRQWPNRLLVSIEEHQPLGTWGDDGHLVSVKGDIFVVNMAEAEEDTDLLTFYGPPGTEKEVVRKYGELYAWFKAIRLEPREVSLSDRYAWTIRLNNGVRVEFGREQNANSMRELAIRLMEVYPQVKKRLTGHIVSIDMRYPNGLALKTGIRDEASED